MSTTKLVYLTVEGRHEQVEFTARDDPQELTEVFRAAAEASPHDILKLYNQKGDFIQISPLLPENTAANRYQLEVVAKPYTLRSISDDLGINFEEMEDRLNVLENNVFTEKGLPQCVENLRKKFNTLTCQLEGVEYLSWLGLHKDLEKDKIVDHFWDKHKCRTEEKQKHKAVFDKYQKIRGSKVNVELQDYLKRATFDNWQWDDAEMLMLLQQMYIDLEFTTKFNIELPVLFEWLCSVYKHYYNVPFHNFKHCFMVAQMMYGLVWCLELRKILSELEILSLLTAAICHDLEHPGYNNLYQINARTALALFYNDISPLENHHCSVAFKILEENPKCNIFCNLTTNQYKKVREHMIRCILATDMSRHSEILERFQNVMPNFDSSNQNHRELLMMILLKVADISNEARPVEVAEPWLDCLLKEFFAQSDTEKLEGLPVAPFMDREKVEKSASQVGFISFVLLPLVESLGSLFPQIEEHLIKPARKSLQYYEEKRNRAKSVEQRITPPS